MATRLLVINRCADCPNAEISRDYTEDSFETCFRHFCKVLKKDVRRYVDWNENPPVPEECPLTKGE